LKMLIAGDSGRFLLSPFCNTGSSHFHKD
jgi:hypothetical protein